MSFFRLRHQPAGFGPSALPPELFQVWSSYQQLDRTQWLGPEELERLQLQQLRALLLHCYHQVPYYRRVLDEAGLSSRPVESLEDFRRLPLLTRSLYQTHFADLHARALPSDMRATGTGYTSGTNGVPIEVRKTNHVDMLWNAFYLRDLEWSGLDPRGRMAAIRLLYQVPKEQLPQAMAGFPLPCWSRLLEPLLETGRAYGMDVRQDPRAQLAWLRRIQPDYLLSFPSNLEFLAGLIAESGLPLPGLQAVQSFGETLTDETRQWIESGFGVPVKNLYSCTEAGYLASPCPLGHGLHVHGENVLVEVLDADDQPCLPGETGRVVLTTLHNYFTPFIRYDLLDEVTLAPGPCPCGRGLPLLTRVAGRRHPLLHLPDGSRKVILVLYRKITIVGSILQYQVVQRAVDHVIVRVVPARDWTADHAERIRQSVREVFGAPIRVDVEETNRLEVTPGGKLKIGIVEIEEHTPTRVGIDPRHAA